MSSPQDDTYFMELALEQAERAAESGEVPVGAVVVSEEGSILARTHNMPVTGQDPTAHAEILALRHAASVMGNYRLTGSTLYVTIEPCPMCAGAMVHARIARVVFGAADPKSGACGTLYNIVQDPRLNHLVEISQGILSERCQALIRDFFRKKRAQAKGTVQV